MMRVLEQFDHLRLQLDVVKSATNNFAEDHGIGVGGFGKVFKGKLISKGNTRVAIKRLDRAFGQGDSEFWKEVIMLSVYKHENIVSLLGFCDEKGEKILVYDYAANKSLDQHLGNNELTWGRRLNICIGAARGLAYLHNPAGTQQRVLHRDIKSSNILLDENWNAKIADLGLSKFGPANQVNTFIITNTAVGTLGYVDPQYIETGFLTKESDVYSFGVVLFEVLCGRLCIVQNDRSSFTSLVREHHRQNKLNSIIWSNMKDEIDPGSLKVFAATAYKCLKRDHKKRPSIEEIVRELKTALEFQEAFQLEAQQKKMYLPGGSKLVVVDTTSTKDIQNTVKDGSSVLPQAEFVDNHSVNPITSKTPFEIMVKKNPITPIDLALIPMVDQFSVEGEERFKEIQELHQQTNQQIDKHNKQYADRSNKHRKRVIYSEGDLVWIHLRRERFFGKHQPRDDGPFRVLKMINHNTYKIQLSGYYNVSATFNVADLSLYVDDSDVDDSDDEEDESTTPFQE